MRGAPQIDLGVEITELDHGLTLAGGCMTVYVAYTAQGELTYVGQSVDLRSRLLKHRKTSGWWESTAVIRTVSGLTETQAFDVELTLIRTLDPPWNRKGRRPDHPRDINGPDIPDTQTA